MRIAKIETTHHRLPLDPPFHASWDPTPRRQFTISVIRVHDDEGRIGVGSGDAMYGFAGNEHLFIGQDPLAIRQHWKLIDNLSFHYGRIWPLDLAIWDLAGKIIGQPVWRLLGGASPRLPLYVSLGTLRTPEALAERAVQLRAQGFKAVKIRFHEADWRMEIAKIEAVRAAVGSDLDIMIDANQGWRMPWDITPSWTLKEALGLARALAPLKVRWLEEPLHRDDHDGMRTLRQQADIRIAGAELAREMGALHRLIDARCLDVLQPDAVCVGGITGLVEIASAARARGIAFTPHTWGNGIGFMGNAQLLGGIGHDEPLEFPMDPPEWTLERRDFGLAKTITADPDGWLTLPQAPGLGLELDEELLARTRVEA